MRLTSKLGACSTPEDEEAEREQDREREHEGEEQPVVGGIADVVRVVSLHIT